jgi:hypothetical protein
LDGAVLPTAFGASPGVAAVAALGLATVPVTAATTGLAVGVAALVPA